MIKIKSILGLLFVAFMFAFTACSDDDDPKVKTPAAPTLNNASEITATGFKVTWSAVTDADVYLLDVSKEADFDPAVTGYAKKEITGTSHVLAGLDNATKYYFRVYAKNGSKVSVASAVKDATTLTAP
ncbi:MAG TPA: fibronectin type III domain-containing protein [Cyclobacteriaceae bacterium]|nr:fibronectin type III domain-containing protein [Cyclobacteriaceae bacterium]HMV08039.1 fibronectin type III domain-containing protein [Cyclobacteriaceae bacterium]HMV88255.1 fibronectin type III domain-containing protein [Cyclobacteriaceae bacterium]HMX00679.1 fibronectin type III domain-containing protein [Cyclobacteriaceae bacterium]HMX49446.1 fibronectin type III domain-containing protein [Cyclobacteriaceae bacterium]